MFWTKIKSKEYTELLEKISLLSVKIAALEIDLLLYVKKLKESKGLEKLEPEQKDLSKGMLLPEDWSSFGFGKKNKSHYNF